MKQIAMDWYYCSEKLPEKEGDYFVVFKNQYTGEFSYVSSMSYIVDQNGGWNCSRNFDGSICNESRIPHVYAWADSEPIKALFEEEEDKK